MKHLAVTLMATIGGALAANSEGFVPLFNGHDLTGWVNANCAPETWSVREGVIHCTGQPVGALRTDRQYENFILEGEWRHLTSGGNSGIFIWGTPIAAPGVPFLRGIEVQVLDHGYATQYEKQTGQKPDWFTTHGDVFPIHGASMKPFNPSHGDRSFPSENRSKGFPEWNHYRIVCTNGIIRLSVNGKEVSGGENCNYRKGYLALESEGAPVDFRNLRIKELPSSGVTAGLTAPIDLGWRTIFSGLDLRGWKTNSATAERWLVGGGRIVLKVGAANPDAVLWTEQKFSDVEIILDCRLAESGEGRGWPPPMIEVGRTTVKLAGAAPDRFQRYVITWKKRKIVLQRDEREIERIDLPSDSPLHVPIGLRDTGTALEFMNLYTREL